MHGGIGARSWLRCAGALLMTAGVVFGGAETFEDRVLQANHFIELQMYGTAERLLRAALAGAEGREEERAAATSNLGLICARTDRLEEARELTEMALQVYQRLGLADREAVTLTNLGAIEQLSGQYLDAAKSFRSAIMLIGKSRGTDVMELVRPLNDLASLYLDRRQFTKAERGFLRVLELQRQHLDPEHPDIARTMNNLGMIRQSLDDYDAAALSYQVALDGLAKAPAGLLSLRAEVLHNLACLHSERGDLERAASAMDEALGTWNSLGNESNRTYATALANMGIIHFKAGRYEEADRLMRRSRALLEDLLPPDHPDVGRVLANHSVVLKKLRRGKAAKQAARQAKAILVDHANENLLHDVVHISDLAFQP
jgi:tetratricopeptide (TPR) repeat protein